MRVEAVKQSLEKELEKIKEEDKERFLQLVLEEMRKALLAK